MFGEDHIETIPIFSLDDENSASQNEEIPTELPILPLRNNVLLPGVIIPISVGRERSSKAVQYAYKNKKFIGVVAQKKDDVEEPELEDIHNIGTVAKIIKLIKMPEGNTVILQGVKKMQVNEIKSTEPYINASISLVNETPLEDETEAKALMATLKELSLRIIDLSPQLPNEGKIVINNIDSLKFLTYFIASNLSVDANEKQAVLELEKLSDKVQLVIKYLQHEMQVQEIKANIHTKTKTDIDQQQKQYFLNQQLKAIQEELGGDMYQEEINRLKEKAKEKKWSKTVGEHFDKEINKLQRINPAAAEYSVILNYLDWMVELPWNEFTDDDFNLNQAKKYLDQDHFGLDKIKDRILEYLAVLKLKGDMKSPILCFVGPPGVGKTSLGKSIARAINRKYIRMALGGLHDESEIRGHRKTYIGALPGRIIQSLKKVQSANPVFILDEVDKVGKDHRGDPSAALLEVLDPEQNASFYDNYLEQEFDLSKVMFIATANSLGDIPIALRDRMEIIQLSGYAVEEKVEIAKKHLIAKQRSAHGLKANQINISNKILEYIIQKYTYESGVRELDRIIASIMRNIAKSIALEEDYEKNITIEQVDAILGKPKYNNDLYTKDLPVGVAVGLAWTPMGGDILFLESAVTKGSAGITLTGNLGTVMKESATTALTYLKSKASDLNIPDNAFKDYHLHIHVPEGAIKKDGPSAGIALLSALASLYTQRPLKPFTALTGEITLRGKVLPVGGIKEKILAAKRANIKEIVLCEQNQKDVEAINESYIKGMQFHFVTDMNEVLDIMLQKNKVKDALDFLDK
ncbi:MAG: endopeptidase La [Chitinophagales bacterium]|nr:endopeptidase La [Chitinophagales bacterium]